MADVAKLMARLRYVAERYQMALDKADPDEVDGTVQAYFDLTSYPEDAILPLLDRLDELEAEKVRTIRPIGGGPIFDINGARLTREEIYRSLTEGPDIRFYDGEGRRVAVFLGATTREIELVLPLLVEQAE